MNNNKYIINNKTKKMTRILSLLTVALTLSIVSNAQFKNGSVAGKVVDGNTKTIESATITLLRAKDSSIAKMSVATKDGQYAFENVPEGTYLVSVSAVGHTKGYSQTFSISAEHSKITLSTI